MRSRQAVSVQRAHFCILLLMSCVGQLVSAMRNFKAFFAATCCWSRGSSRHQNKKSRRALLTPAAAIPARELSADVDVEADEEEEARVGAARGCALGCTIALGAAAPCSAFRSVSHCFRFIMVSIDESVSGQRVRLWAASGHIGRTRVAILKDLFRRYGLVITDGV